MVVQDAVFAALTNPIRLQKASVGCYASGLLVASFYPKGNSLRLITMVVGVLEWGGSVSSVCVSLKRKRKSFFLVLAQQQQQKKKKKYNFSFFLILSWV
jgi:hypothetical protein